MTIEVKASKQSAPGEEPRKKFDFFSREKMTTLPVHIGLVIVAFALYFRHLFSPQAPESNKENREASRAEQEGETAAPRRAGKGERNPEEAEAQGKKVVADLDQYDVKSDVDWSPSILVSDPVGSLHFTKPHFDVQPIGVFPAAFGVELSNDNIPRTPIPRPVISVPNRPDEVDTGPQEPGNPDGGDEDDDDDRPNRAPTTSGPVRLNDIFAGQAALIGLTHLLAGAQDPDGDALTVTNLTATGLDFAMAAGGWAAQSEHGMLGAVTLTYRISDGQAAVWQTAHFNIVRNSVVLSPEDGLFVGTAYDDDIEALAGDDIVNAMDGDDMIVGGLGNDHLFGDAGDDVLRGGAGMDVIFGGGGNDIIHGGDGDDRLFGDAGRDTLFGDAGNDWLEGGDGDDIIDGGTGDDDLLGGLGEDTLIGAVGHDGLSGDLGNDTLDGGSGQDTLSGGDGNDILSGGEGDDVADGGSGNDTFVGGSGNDTYDGGGDFDVLSYALADDDLIIDDRTGQASGAGIGEDTFTGFEQVDGGEGDDLFVIGAAARIISGGSGRDMFVFEVLDDDPTLSEDVVHDILDFVVGDRIRVRDYDISHEARAAERDLFRSIYGDEDDDWLRADIPVLVIHDSLDGVDKTIIRADFNSDDVFDVTISIRDVLLAWTNDPVLA